MGRKCGVQGCLSDSNRIEDVGVTFHKVPMQTEIRSKWLSLCHISDEKKSLKVVYVCSRHFLRADFCNFKGKKYLLRQGVFPSVFPWDKSKLEAIKSEKNRSGLSIKSEPKEHEYDTNTEASEAKPEIDLSLVKQEKEEDIGNEVDSISKDDSEDENAEMKPINFAIDKRINALDFDNKWYPAVIMEIDEKENEVLIHFENNPKKDDEWICMDSPRLRSLNSEKCLNEDLPEDSDSKKTTTAIPLKSSSNRKKVHVPFYAGERCYAYWSEKRKFPATVSKVLDQDTYEVLFDDGFSKTLKWKRLVKIQDNQQISPLFDPITSSKQDRRDRKRKLNVAELFGIGKRQRSDSSGSPKVKSSGTKEELNLKICSEPDNWVADAKTSSAKAANEVLDDNGKWLPRWIDGLPVGEESQLEFQDGLKRTFIVPDPRIPEGWSKHLVKRSQGMNPGKWDTLIVSPDGKKFRSRGDIKNYLENTKLLAYDEKMFDFSMCKPRQKKSAHHSDHVRKQRAESKTQEVKQEIEEFQMEPSQQDEEQEDVNLLKIPMIDDAYKCPIEGCGKNFRKENLAQMHVKHYHPEYSKFLDTTPNVADLAYARTVGDSLDKSPVHVKSTKIKTSTPKVNQPQSPGLEETDKAQSPIPSKNSKDSEIIKLLNTKPFDSKSEGEPLPSGLPSNMYPDIKLKDLLSKSEGIPKRGDINLRTLSITRPPAGIKTLLPVRKENKNEDSTASSQDTPVKAKYRSSSKRRRGNSDQLEANKMKEVKEEVIAPAPQIEPVVPPENSNVIIEGGQVIKIVRMKQEEIINCTCGFTEEDGLMIQCELCLCWQHAYCNNIQKESEVPEKYICYICQNPLRQRSSRKYYHDQDWLKQGTLPVGSYHAKDEEQLQERFEKLKKSHDISGGLVELQEFVNTLNIKLKIAEEKNHPKLYLWSKPWKKLSLPENMEEDEGEEEKEQKETTEEKLQTEEESQLNKDLKSLIENQPQIPIIPQPEAAIDSADCKLNLLDHILHSQNLVLERISNFEKQLYELEKSCPLIEKDEDYPITRQTLQMLMRDLGKMEDLGQNTSI